MPKIPIGVLLSSVPDGLDPALALAKELHATRLTPPHPPIKAERGERVRITIQSSKDDGKTWSHELLINDGPSAYWSLAGTTDGQVALLCHKDKDIVFATLAFNEIAG